MENVKVIRMLGEDLIAEVLKETKDTITVQNPVRIVIIPNKEDPKNPSVGFSPYLEWTSDTVFNLSKAMFLCMAEPLPLFTDQYKKQFSNLILPTKSQIIV